MQSLESEHFLLVEIPVVNTCRNWGKDSELKSEQCSLPDFMFYLLLSPASSKDNVL
jgi:hypothetical protein